MSGKREIMKKEKLVEYSPDNPLGWTEEEFKDTICQMVNIRILTGDYITPMLNCYYLNNSGDWHRKRLGMTKDDTIKMLDTENREQSELIHQLSVENEKLKNEIKKLKADILKG